MDTADDANAGRERPTNGGLPTLTMPKGGGAVRGIGEKFGVDAVTGTGSLTLPIATSPGRQGFGPDLSLAYDSGAGNGPFGFGWRLPLPAITRKTDLGLPRYDDAVESDVFILSGAEDLVPIPWPGPRGLDDVETSPDHSIRRYRPRVDSLFSRIERWTRNVDGDVHWRSISRDNILTIYGSAPAKRIADPADPTRVFSWLISESRDDRGNAIIYDYKSEDGVGVDLGQARERNRGPLDDPRRATNRYLKSIRYGNRRPLLDAEGRRPRRLSDLPGSVTSAAGWMFEVVFDYGEHDQEVPTPAEASPWDLRPDPFSSYRSGFEVRTNRRCRRVLTFHHVPDSLGGVPGYDGLVRSTNFGFSTEPDEAPPPNATYSFLQAVTQTGHAPVGQGYVSRSFPPIELQYSRLSIGTTTEEVDVVSLENLPAGFDGDRHRWLDLHGDGIPGFLTGEAGAWFYKRNLSPIASGASLESSRVVDLSPTVDLAGTATRFVDLAGDGSLDVLVLDGPTTGFFEHDDAEGWGPFRPLDRPLSSDLAEPSLRMVDLTGDGLADAVVADDDELRWYQSLGEEGFDLSRRVRAGVDEEEGPRVVFADGTDSVYLADLSGDGLVDLVRVRNGEVCYWPNLGYGRFGARVVMDGAPVFDSPDRFDQSRIRLADVDGSGTTDLLYLAADGVRLFFNGSGNEWSEPVPVRAFPQVDDLAQIQVADLLGNGTACLVWSSPFDPTSMRYVNLTGEKPHLLTHITNNVGVETTVRYAPSTKFSLADRRAGRPWLTRLPFPVHVVESVESADLVSGSRSSARYAYHHGYFDPVEREFRGFAMVEQWDADSLPGPTGGPFDSPPVHTKTWFHTGADLEDRLAEERYRQPGSTEAEWAAQRLGSGAIPASLVGDDRGEALRALRGSMLRRETFAVDGSVHEGTPYLVAEQNLSVRLEQARGLNRHAVFFAHPAETIEHTYERRPDDARSRHTIVLHVDAVGTVLQEVTIAYGRGPSGALERPEDRLRQATPIAVMVERDVTNAVDLPAYPDDHRAPETCASRRFELTGYTATGPAGRFTTPDFVDPATDPPTLIAHSDLRFEQEPSGGRERRLVDCTRTTFRRDDLSALLLLGRLDPLALRGESYRLALTPELITAELVRGGVALLPDPAAVLAGAGGGGYRSTDDLIAEGVFPSTDAIDGWWMPSGRLFFSAGSSDDAATELAAARAHFFLTRRARSPFHRPGSPAEGVVRYDEHDLLVVETLDPVGNRVTVGERSAGGALGPRLIGHDYRVLQPRVVADANRNRSEFAFDPLGLVAATAVRGKPEETLGDDLDQLDPNADPAAVLEHLEDPATDLPAVIGAASTRVLYDLDAFHRTRNDPHPSPVTICTLTREVHHTDAVAGQPSPVQRHYLYLDGRARQVQTKAPAEPGPLVPGGPDVTPRWVGTGWVVYDNKDRPARQYEPFFSPTHRFQPGIEHGVAITRFRDPLGRVVATLHPDATYEKVVFDAWSEATWDANDTVEDDPRTDPDVAPLTAGWFASLDAATPPVTWSTWLATRTGVAVGQWDAEAAGKARAHAGTPTIAHLDPLGRPFLLLADHGPPSAGADHELFATRVDLDVDGHPVRVRDALVDAAHDAGRTAATFGYDMAGRRIRQASMDAGRRWSIADAAGQPMRSWDDRGNDGRWECDPLRRPVRRFVVRPIPGGAGEVLVERVVHGEQVPDGEACNLRTKAHLHLDQAGLVTTDEYDFKGNPTKTSRRYCNGTQYRAIVDWTSVDSVIPPGATTVVDVTALDAALDVRLHTERFGSAAQFDALNRVVVLAAPSAQEAWASRIRHRYDEAGLLATVDVNIRGARVNGIPTWTPFVRTIERDAKGQRSHVDYGPAGSGAFSTDYDYDPLTYRLIGLRTRREPGAHPEDDPQPPSATWPGRLLQSLTFTHDPVGNITHRFDDAQQAVFFANHRVEPSADFTYDALYRLIEAKGREHIGQAGVPTEYSASDSCRTGLPSGNPAGMYSPLDGTAMGTYTETYGYDAVGNLKEQRHRGTSPANAGWTRSFEHTDMSVIEDGSGGTDVRHGNRLSSSTVSGTSSSTDPITYDPHGNMTRLVHLGGGQAGPNLLWDEWDRLRSVALGGGGTAYYVYDSAGQRVRKVWEKAPGLVEERFYLGGVEVHRVTRGADVLERETLHVLDDERRIALVETRMVDTAHADVAPPLLVRYQVDDHLGSSCLELDDQARIITYEEYSPYGDTTYQGVRRAIETPKRYRFTAKERDEESGLTYHGARFYAPWLCRWTACDPIWVSWAQESPGDPRQTDHESPLNRAIKDCIGIVNLYCYCRNNPHKFVDHDGRDPTALANEIVTKTGELLTNVQTGHAQYQGTFDAALAEAQGLQTWDVGRGKFVDHASQLSQGVAAINNKLTDIYATIAQLRKEDAGLAGQMTKALAPVLQKTGEFTITANETLAEVEVLKANYGTRLQGVLVEVGGPSSLGRTEEALMSSRLSASGQTLMPAARSALPTVQATMRAIQQLPVTVQNLMDVARNQLQQLRDQLAAVTAGAAAARTAAPTLRARLISVVQAAGPALAGFGARLVNIIVIPTNMLEEFNGGPRA